LIDVSFADNRYNIRELSLAVNLNMKNQAIS